LEQPYNSDLNFGTGDFCISFWYYPVNITGSTDWLISRSGSTFSVWQNSGNFGTSLGGTNRLVSSNAPASNSGWHQIIITRSGSFLELHRNGVSIVTETASDNITSSEGLMIGNLGNDLSRWLAGKLSLLRISTTAPTAEQIAKMYRDEKPLFQEGAQATLYGTSDAVTALAYDDDTELLHAGTSAGRSVFQGLRRVSNTTDAVGVAISASNDLVVEE
jgi:hypothetical protein